MRKILTLMSMICIIMFTNYAAYAVAIDASSSGNWSGYMAWFETDGTTKGTNVGGSNWGVADLNASYTADSLTLSPNTNTYADNIGSADPNAVAYWTNGDDGNKWMDATINWKLPAITKHGMVKL